MNQQNKQPEKERRWDQELLKKGLRRDRRQYQFLKLCSKKGDEGIKRWNKWRYRHKKGFLEGADLSHLYLKGINLGWGAEKNPRRHVYYGLGFFGHVYLKDACFDYSNIEDGRFGLADLRDSKFMDAKLEGACFNNSDLRGAYFTHAIVNSSTLIWECPVTKLPVKSF